MNSIFKSKSLSYILALLTFLILIAFVIFRQTSSFDINIILDYKNDLLKAFLNTIFISLITLVGSLVLGFIFYLLSNSKIKYFNALINIFTEVIYGTPLLVLVVVFAFLIGPAFGTYQRNILGVTALIFYMAPYMKNVFKSAISSIDPEQ